MIAAPLTAYLVTHFYYMLCGQYQDNFAIAFVVIALMAFGAFVSVTQFGTVKARDSERNQKEEETPVTLTKFFAQNQNFIFITMTFLVGCFDGVVLTFGFWYTKTLDVSIATLVFGFSRMTCSAVCAIPGRNWNVRKKDRLCWSGAVFHAAFCQLVCRNVIHEEPLVYTYL